VNVLGFVPLGLVLGEFGLLRALAVAALISGFAETGQVVMLYRDPSVSDFIANVLGALLGAAVSARWKISSPELRVNRWITFVAAAVAFALMAQVWTQAGPAINTRGTTSPGTLEAHWKLDETGGRIAFDSSGHNLNGRFSKFELVSGPTSASVVFGGKKEYVDVGRSTALRLAGSMTSWTRPSTKVHVQSDSNLAMPAGNSWHDMELLRSSLALGITLPEFMTPRNAHSTFTWMES